MESEIFGPDVPHTTVLQQNHQKNDVGCIMEEEEKILWRKWEFLCYTVSSSEDIYLRNKNLLTTAQP